MDDGSRFRLRRPVTRQTKDKHKSDEHYKYSFPTRATAVPRNCTVSGALAFVLRLSRVAGIAPLDFVEQSSGSWEIKVSKNAYIYSVVLVSALNIIALSAISIDLIEEHKKTIRMRTLIRGLVWTMDFLAVILTNNVITHTAPARMQAMIVFLSRIQKINSEVEHNVVPTFTEKRLKIMAVLIISFSASVLSYDYYMILIDCIQNNRNKIVVYLNTAYYCQYLNLTLINLQFGLTILVVNSSFKAVNDNLDRLCCVIKDKGIQDIEDSPTIERYEIPFDVTVPLKSINIVIDKITYITDILKPRKKSVPETIRTLGVFYLDVADIIKTVNKYFGVITMMMLLTTLIHLIISPFYLLTALFIFPDPKELVTLQSAWCIKHFITMLLLVDPCHRTYQEATRTHKLMVSLACHTTAALGSFVNELRRVFWCVRLSEMVFAPMGMFTLTRPICVAIMGIVTTYLVVVLQFNTKDDVA